MFQIKGTHLVINILGVKISIKLTSLFEFIERTHVKNILKKIYNEKSLIVLGDSHTDIFHNNEYDEKKIIYGHDINSHIYFNHKGRFITYHLSSVTAYNSNQEQSSTNCLKKVKFLINNHFIPSNATCVCVMGEIDCRVHVQRQAEKAGISIEENIDMIINNYREFLKLLEKNKLKIIVYGPIPSQPDNIPTDSSYPRYGTQLERNKITRIFNKKLEEMCLLNNYKFVTLFDKLVDENLNTKVEMLNSNDYVHLGSKAYPMVCKLFSNQ